jgi:hypothetical protein
MSDANGQERGQEGLREDELEETHAKPYLRLICALHYQYHEGKAGRMTRVAKSIDFRCEDGCFLVSAKCVTISKPDCLYNGYWNSNS